MQLYCELLFLRCGVLLYGGNFLPGGAMKYSARELWPVRVCAALAVLILLILPAPASSEQSEEERNFLLTYFTEDELQVVSSTRSIKSISRVAENMTVVTAKDIERMNAHTLAEVLNTVNGVHVWLQGSAPGPRCRRRYSR